MASPAAALKDFFISYNKADRVWAEWIAWQLEAAGYTTIIQAWDFLAGGNFMAEMDAATKMTHHMIAVLSPDYLKSGYTRLEWTAALARDPTSTGRPVISVRVRDLGEEFSGLLAVIACLDLVGLGEDAARERLLAQASGKRGKPAVAPAFPGLMQQAVSPPAFPGLGQQPSLWLVPHRRNPYFTGREETLQRLLEGFSAGQGIVTQAITGLGGMGKTQTALEYLYRHQQEYQAVFWVQAETRELLIGDFGKIAALLALPERDAQNQEEMLAAVTRWLETHPGWLLVLDNVEEATREQEIWPRRGSGHIVLTARAQSPSAAEQRSSLQPLPPDEAARFLLRRAHLKMEDAEQQTQARAIAEELGSLPLALDQAGAYIDETGCSLMVYMDLCQHQRAALLRRRGAGVTDHPEAVALTWKLAFVKVEQASPAAADLLRLCAFLHPEAIPEDLFHDGAAELTPALRKAVKDGLQWNEAIAALRRFSLIERQSEKQMLSIHQLVQAVLQDDLPAAASKRWAERAVRVVNAAFPSGNFGRWERCQQLLPHALTCAEHIEAWHLAPREAAFLLTRAAHYLKQRAQYAEALPLLQRALRILEQTLGPTHHDVAIGLNNLAELYREQGQYEEALPLYQRALALDEQTHDPSHHSLAFKLNNLALLYYAQGQYEEALPLLQRALRIFEQMLGLTHPNVATTLSNLGAIYEAQGQYAEALSLYQRALAIDEQVLGPTHPDVAFKLNNLAELYNKQGQYEEALPLFQRALGIWEQALGLTHPLVATCLDNLANLYQAQRQYAEARPLYQRALAIDEQVLGPTHPDLAISLNNLAILYKTLGQYAEALPLYQRALAIWEQAVGSDHPNVAICLGNLAVLLHEMGQEEQAREYYVRAQAIRDRRKAAGT